MGNAGDDFGDEFTVNGVLTNIQNEPAVRQLGDGRVLFVWSSYDPSADGDGYGIVGRVGALQPDGSIVWSSAGEFTVNVNAVQNQTDGDITVLSDGRVMFTWRSADASVDGSFLAVSVRIGAVQSDGSILWGAAGEFTVAENTQGWQWRAQSLELPDGRVLFTWQSDTSAVDGSGGGVAARIGTVQSDGSILWGSAGEFSIAEEVDSGQQQPQVTLLADGRLLFTWSSNDPDVDGNFYGITGRVGAVQPDGSITWASHGEFTVNLEVEGLQQEPQVAVLSDGRVLFVWQSADPDVDGNSDGIAGRIGAVEADGSIAWADAGEFTINALAAGVQSNSCITVLGDGRVLVVFTSQDLNVDGDSFAAAARLGSVQADGSIAWEAVAEFSIAAEVQSGQFGPRAILLDDGRVLLTWHSFDPDIDSNSGIAGRVVLFNGLTSAQNDAFAISEVNAIFGGDLFADNGSGIDTEADSEPFTVTAVNGSALNVGSQITLASGALLTVNANGTFDYAPNSGPEPMYQTPAIDSFTYTIDDGFGGTSTATVTISVSSVGELIVGDYLANTLNGGAYGDLIIAVEGDDTINGGDGADALDGGDGADTLNGEAGGDALYGRAGIDTLNGGEGRDTLYGGDADDVLNGGADEDVLDGGADNDLLYGDGASDTLRGRAGNDVLDGGAGADFMFGGAGDDTYHVDNAGDEAGELSASGHDTVIASINYVLPFYIEDLILTGGALNGAGNVLANTITGTAGDNVLQGLGGSDAINAGDGADTIYGGDGLDTLSGENGNDVIDGGNFDDTLIGGDGDDILYGRQNDDTLIGESGADTLYGGDGADDADGGDGGDLIDGGNGDDTLAGGAGNDTLYGRQNNDTLSGGDDDDFLYGGDGVDTLNGEAGADALFGGNGDDRLDGGLGADILNGGGGADTFVFSTALGGGNIDTMTAFSVADDTIELSTAIFTGIGIGALAANAFVIGSAATTADHRIIYNPTTGALLYDADGNGAGAAIRFGTLATGLALTEADFLGGP